MGNYLACSPFVMKTPLGETYVKKGDELIVPASTATRHVQHGVIVDKFVGFDLMAQCQARLQVLTNKFGFDHTTAALKAQELVVSLLKRHESLKSFATPSSEFMAVVEEFNRNATGSNPVTKIPSDQGAGEWAGYRCNIGEGCSHGCLYCYAEKMASRFDRIVSPDEWVTEIVKDCSTAKARKALEPIMFPTAHDISEAYLPAYRCHLHNLLSAGNSVVLVSKPHRVCIEAICSEITSFRDSITFRFSIGGLDHEALRLWEPGAPSLDERLECLKYVFEQGFNTSVSAEPMLVDRLGAERLYYMVEPYITDTIWFGKMNNVGGFRKAENPELARRAGELIEAYKTPEILKLVESLNGLPKVEWKDSIKTVIDKNNQIEGTNI